MPPPLPDLALLPSNSLKVTSSAPVFQIPPPEVEALSLNAAP
jgi:hypothetical protein